MDQTQPAIPALPLKKKFFTKKKIIWAAVILLAAGFIGYQIFKPKNNSANIQTDTVKKQDLKATVLATGQVVSSTDLDLSFKTSGIVEKVNVQEGQQVKAGQVLANLEQKNQLASLTSAQGALAQAQANYNKVLAGSSSQNIAVAQVALDNAKANLTAVQAQQDTAVKNAYATLLNSTITAIPSQNNLGTGSITVSGFYSGSDQGVYKITIISSGNGLEFQSSGLEDASGDVKTTPVALGAEGLYLQFSGTPFVNDIWTITIPNTSASTYVANYNAYQAALQAQSLAVVSAQNSVASAQAALDLQTAQPQPADVQAAQAQILSAQGQVQAAQAALDDTSIRAPASGTITSVDTKVGELAPALQEVLILQDVSSLHVEADVSEANISSLMPNQSVDITFDALGPDRHFTGTVLTVNPGATIISGVVDYLVKASIPVIPGVKPGMTANMTVLVAQKNNVLAVPGSAIFIQNNQQYVRVIDNDKTKTYHQVAVQTGLQADGGLVEITGGLTEGQEIVTYIKQ